MRPISLPIAHLGHDKANRDELLRAKPGAAPSAVQVKKTLDQSAIRGWLSSPATQQNVRAALDKIDSRNAPKEASPATKSVFARFKFNLRNKTAQRLENDPPAPRSIPAPALQPPRPQRTGAEYQATAIDRLLAPL
jgi:hypothetical protein